MDATCNRKKIVALRSNFLWEGGMRDHKGSHIVKWDMVLLPKKINGLGIRNIRPLNIAMLAKHFWRLNLTEIPCGNLQILQESEYLDNRQSTKIFPFWNDVIRAMPFFNRGWCNKVENGKKHISGKIIG